MWLEKTSQGKFKAVERYKDPMTGKDRKASIVIEKDTPKTRKAAQIALADKIRELTEKGRVEHITFGGLVRLYLQYQETAVRASSLKTIRTAVEALVSIIGKDTLAEKLSAAYVYGLLSSRGEKPVTQRNRVHHLKAVIRWGYRHEYLESCAWLDRIPVVRDDGRRARTEDKYLEPDELAALISGMPKDSWRLLTRFLALTGMRVGEALALEMSDIRDKYIAVTKTFMINVGAVGDAPKTADSVRDIYIQPELAALIKEIKKWRLEELMRSGTRSELLFTEAGTALKYTAYYMYLKKWSEKLIGRAISPHALRHTHVSILAAQGVSLDAVARRLGHHDDAITREVYFHVTRKLRERDAEMMDTVHIV